jgi:uncharacterized membrane protein YdjX (TVP38/TMEM64 family)
MDETVPPASRRPLWRRLLPVIVIAAAIALVFALRLDRYLSFDTLAQHHAWLMAKVEAAPVLAPLVFVAIYAAAAALSLPGAIFLTIASGFLFGYWGAALSVVGATIGATLLFLAARSALREVLRAKAGDWVRRLEAGFRDNALSYLLVLRLVPLFPFWLVNLVPAFLGVRLSTFVIGTFIGIIPGALVYASVGRGLEHLIAEGEPPDLGIIFEPDILLPLLGLALLALVPVAYKRWRGVPPGAARGAH